MTEQEIYQMLVAHKVPVKPVNHAQILVAVAKSESGLNATARGDGGNSIGIFQIYMPAHPDKLQRLTGSKDRNVWIRWLEYPANNTLAAIEVYRSQGLGAWTDFRNGNYKKYMGDSSIGSTSGTRLISLASGVGGSSEGGSGARRGDGTYEKAMEQLFVNPQTKNATTDSGQAPQVPTAGGKFPNSGNVNAIKNSDRYISEFARVAINYDLKVAGPGGANVPEVIKNRASKLGKIITAAEKEIGYKYPRSNINKIYTR